MSTFAVIGGGISGLSVLHYLKRKYPNADIALYERCPEVGGTISTLRTGGFLFETGPNAFLTNSLTLEFIDELGMTDQMVCARESSKRRYIQLDGKLLLLPTDPFAFIQTPILTASEKLRFLSGLLNKNISKDQSVYDYTSQRFGETVTDRFIDPFLTGIYAGDIRRLHMEHAFPKFSKGGKKSILCSFKEGMGSLMNALREKYRASIHLGQEIGHVSQIKADVIVISTPAYETSRILNMNALNRVVYSPVAVVGIKALKSHFKTVPDGFGYLIPSSEGKEILGVLLENNVFPRQTKDDEVILRIMMGGAHHREIIQKDERELIAAALREIDLTYGLKAQPQAYIKVWPKAIPQYDLDYPKLLAEIKEEMKQYPHVRLCANYLGGISFNDCIKSACQLANQL